MLLCQTAKMQNWTKIQSSSLICRTCLQGNNTLTPIYESTTTDMLQYCSLSTILEDESLPSNICTSCLNLLEVCYKFRQQCERSYSTLKTCSTEQEIAQNDNSTFDVLIIESRGECSTHNFENSVDSVDGKEGYLNLQNVYKETPKEDFTSFLEQPLPKVSLEFQCTKCEESFSEENDLNVHQSVHNPNNVCVVCSKKFFMRQTLKRHLKTHLVNKPHCCQICLKGFAESHALQKHLKRHSGISDAKKYVCQECGQSYREPYYLNVHMRKHTGERPLVCEVCKKSFADPRSYKVHSLIHTGEKPYKCTFCDKSFVQSVNLTKHVRIHTGEKPFACKTCGKAFSQSSSLKKHARTHTGEKPYTCDKCDKSFSEKGALVIHFRRHANEKSFSCVDCSISFVTKTELNNHYKSNAHNTGSKLLKKKHLQCSSCGNKFRQQTSLKRHLKRQHGFDFS